MGIVANPVFQVLAGAGTMKLISGFGKELLRGWTRTAGRAGQEVMEDVVKRLGYGSNFIPFVGPSRFVYNIFSRGGFRQSLTAGKSAWTAAKNATSELRSLQKDVLNKKWLIGHMGRMKSDYVDSKAEQTLRHTYIRMLKSMKHNPKTYIDDMQGMWKKAMGSLETGIDTSRVSLQGAWETGAMRVAKAMEHAESTKALFGTHMISNAAVIGFPTLTSGVATAAITRAAWGRTRRKLRGYEGLTY